VRRRRGVYDRWLATTALAYAVLHHLGLLPSGLGSAPDGTQWADWLDLLVPWLVLGPAAATLWAARPPTRTWMLFGAGVVTYASGHGIHLSANSIGNEEPGRTAHLWDEVVGHHLWYLGVALVVAALAATMNGRPRPGPTGYVLASAVGLTWASNAVGGGTVVMSLVLAVGAAAYGFARHHDLRVVLLVAAVPSVAVLAVALVRGLG
jgi:hypothetical protein